MLDALDRIAGPAALAALVVATIALLLAISTWRRGMKAPTPPRWLPDDPSMEKYIIAQAERLEQLTTAVDQLQASRGTADAGVRHAIQHIGLVRFNPYGDVGGHHSFALALLDANADGVVLTSLHSRGATRVYVKAILAGRAEIELSEEELAALRDAGLEV